MKGVHRRLPSLYKVVWLSESVDDSHEGFGLEGSATDEATVHVGFGKELCCVGGLAAASVEDGGVVGNFSAILVSDSLADEGVHLLCLVVGSGLACADSPYGFIGEDDLAEFSCIKIEQTLFNLAFHDVKEAAILALLEHFTDAEDRGEAIVECETHFLAESLGGLAVVLATLGVAEDYVGGSGGSNHGG